MQDASGGTVRGESEGCECIHYHVDPEELDRSEYRTSFCDGSDKRDDHGGDVDCQLELKRWQGRSAVCGQRTLSS